MKTFRIFFVALSLPLFVGSSSAQPYFYLTNTPANGDFYVPGETVTAIFTIMEDGSLGKMRVTSKTDTNTSIIDLQPFLTLTDHYPPVREYQLAINIPSDFTSSDTVFVFEVTATKYGTHTTDFKLKTGSSRVGYLRDITSLELALYPNPARNTVTIESPLISSGSTVTFIDSRGESVPVRIVGTPEFGKLIFDASQLTDGAYTVQVRGQAGIASQKLIIR